MARARRKNVPSIQRSPYSSTLSHSRTLSAKPRVVMSQASLQLVELPVVLDQPHLREHPGEAPGRGRRPRRPHGPLAVDAAQHPGLGRRGAAARRARRGGGTARPSESDISFSEGRRPAHSSPYCRSRKNSSVCARGPGPRVERRLAVLDDQHRIAGLVAAQVGVRGVRAEPVVGVVGPDLEGPGRHHQPLAGERLGQPGTTRGRPRRHRVRGQVQLAVAPARCA